MKKEDHNPTHPYMAKKSNSKSSQILYITAKKEKIIATSNYIEWQLANEYTSKAKAQSYQEINTRKSNSET